MKIEQKDTSFIFSTTSIPDIFFTEYLSCANGDFIKVYLYMVFLSKYNKDIKINDLSKALNIPVKTIQEACTYWEGTKVITKKPNGYIVNNLQDIELHKLYSPKVTLSPKDIEQNSKNQYRAKAIESINNNYFQGIMSPSWYGDIEMWFKKYGFDEQVMITLFDYCFNKSALHRNYIQAVADAWSKNNIKTYSDLENYEQAQEKLVSIKKSISKKLKLTRQLTQYEEAYIEKWIVDFKYDMDVIDLALKKTTSKTNPSFDYLDKLISDWHDRNLKSPSEVEQFLSTYKKQTSNIKELAKKTGYSNYEQRSYENLDSLYANNM